MSYAERTGAFVAPLHLEIEHWWYREGTSRLMERHQTIRAYSAGGVVFRLVPEDSRQNKGTTDPDNLEQYTGATVEVALVGRSHPGIWALPKGTPRSGETFEQVALREVQEETGLEVRLIAYIGSISYFFIRDKVRFQKQVRHYLFEAIGGDTALHDSEYDRVEWFSFSEAARRMTYQNEANILYQAEEILERWLQDQQKVGKK
jgi:8-oxo-dGTP pyrophosphatase MutT (NUDIX family)